MKYFTSILIAILAITAYYTRDQLQTLLRPVLSNITTKTQAITSRNLINKHPDMSSQKNSSFAGLPVIPPNDPSLTSTASKPRTINKVFEAVEQAEGAGARVRRSVGTAQLRNFSPFLLLDNFSIAPGAGFPDHPHRGQETITYLLKGAVDHEDFAGNRGTIETGDLQFMTAGRGIVHAEMPHQNEDGSENVGLQLWVDLPEKLKDCEPRYRDLKASEIPSAKSEDGKVDVKVISGRAYGVDSLQELAYTPVWLLDVTVQPGGTFSENIPAKWNSFLYTLSGSATYGSGYEARKVDQYHNIVWNQEGDTIVASVDADAASPARFVLVAGLPLDQKIIQYGPFVVSKQEDIYKAMFDYQSYSNGFERARDWESEIGKTMVH